jgi:hypothetical protein
MEVDLNDFKYVVECVYKGERYSVRDNGVVLRHIRKGKRPRKYDNQWTFGKPNGKTGYMEIASVRIHRIVATAFHGVPPTKEHVVDHIDTNRRNNRPENLRWVTRLENVLLNSITVKRIELACECGIEEFLADPSKFRDKFQEPNYKWMTTVSKEEAKASKEKLLAWAESNKLTSGGSLGEWIYSRNTQEQYVAEEPEFTTSLSPNAKQKDWKTPTEFPLCPKNSAHDYIVSYKENLKIGEIFSRNKYSTFIIENFAISKDRNTLWVMCKNNDDEAIKPWSLAQVSYEDEFFIHKNLGGFFKKDGAEKQFTIAQGLEWTGGDTFDDFT